MKNRISHGDTAEFVRGAANLVTHGIILVQCPTLVLGVTIVTKCWDGHG